MRKGIIFLSILVLSLSLFSVEDPKWANPNPKLVNMKAFMEMEWGCTAAYFHDNFPYKDNMEIMKNHFYSGNFKLAGIEFSWMAFIFANKEGFNKINKKNAGDWVLEKVYAFIEPDDFDKLHLIFREKYGPPNKVEQKEVQNRMGAKFLQKTAYWENKNIKRTIYLSRYANNITRGSMILIPLTKPEDLQAELKKAAKKF